MTDPTRTEDVEEALLNGVERDAFKSIEQGIEGARRSEARDGLGFVRGEYEGLKREIRDLRSRLEEVEADLLHTKRKMVDPEEMHRARRRADRLEGALRTVLNEHRMAEDWSLPERLEEYLTSALSALDSREDEGEDERCPYGTTSEAEGCIVNFHTGVWRTFDDCPVHREDEGEGRCPGCGALLRVHPVATTSEPYVCSGPTDEPVSREGERFADAFAEGHALGWDDVPLLDAMDWADTLDPTHADARSEDTERTMAEHWRSRYRQAAREISDLEYVHEAAEKVVEQIPAYEKSVVGELADALERLSDRHEDEGEV